MAKRNEYSASYANGQLWLREKREPGLLKSDAVVPLPRGGASARSTGSKSMPKAVALLRKSPGLLAAIRLKKLLA
eukprot:7273327-Prymnesium_polylepis.2